ncbi:MAG TPA: LLM class flavin-dependent oxidoreductase [Nitrososphaerales archaeon]|nr:LLM class flavin-dependent oxidoreductase [Nitrososphaerales archaeon]
MAAGREEDQESRRRISFGVNVNTRVPLIYPAQYTAENLLDFSKHVEELGYDSVWVGDSILAKPRLDPLSILSAISSRTTRVKLGTACMIAPLRNPILLARTWATLDILSRGRTSMAVCIGPGTLEYEKLGIHFGNRGRMVEEYVQLLRRLWQEDGVTFSGKYYNVSNVTLNPKPIQKPAPPICIVGWPYGHGAEDREEEVVAKSKKLAESIFTRVVKHGDGWMFDGFATPEGVRDGVENLKRIAKSEGKDFSKLDIVYQMTLNVNSSKSEAESEAREFISKYYGNLSRPMESWGPFGSAKVCIDWIERFRSAGVTTIILRFASPDQSGQLKRFTEQIYSAFR